jgi:hypothetical protein
MTHTIHQAIALAGYFAGAMQDEIGTAEFRTMNYLNKVENNPLICHSHDYCDANMVMHAAMTEYLGREPDLQSDADTALWNDAWAIAKAAGFDF